VEMLRCLFPKTSIKEVDMENVHVLFKFADEYDIGYLKKKCFDFLSQKLSSIQEGDENVSKIFLIAFHFKLSDFFRMTFPAMARLDSSKFQNIAEEIPSEIKSAILLQMVGQVRDHKVTPTFINCKGCMRSLEGIACCDVCDLALCNTCARRLDPHVERCVFCHQCKKTDHFAQETNDRSLSVHRFVCGYRIDETRVLNSC